jgi:adenylate cyclase
MAFLAHSALGDVAVHEAPYDDAASCFAKAVQVNPRFSLCYFFQTAALALAGRVEEARPIVGQLLELEPAFRSSAIFQHGLTRAVVDKLIEGARLLDLPE